MKILIKIIIISNFRISFDIMKRILSPWLYPNFMFNLSASGRRFKKYVSVLHRFTKKVRVNNFSFYVFLSKLLIYIHVHFICCSRYN